MSEDVELMLLADVRSLEAENKRLILERDDLRAELVKANKLYDETFAEREEARKLAEELRERLSVYRQNVDWVGETFWPLPWEVEK